MGEITPDNPPRPEAGDPAVEIKYIHSSGPGGQNVNKVATAVQLFFDPAKAGLGPEQRTRLALLAGRQLGRDGLLVITARRHRSQALNKAEALERLWLLLAKALAPPPRPRRRTRPGRGAVERRLAAKKLQARRKAGRAAVGKDNF